MITFLQNLLQKHLRWVLFFLLGIIVASFVFTLGSPGVGRKRKSKKFYGVNLASPREFESMMQKAFLSQLLQQDYTFLLQKNVEQYALRRVICLYLAQELKLPDPTEKDLLDFIQKIPLFQDGQKKFDGNRYQEFCQDLKKNKTFPETLVSVTLEEDFKIQQVNKALLASFYVFPEISEKIFKNTHGIFSFTILSLDKNNFSYQVPPGENTEARLQSFYEEHRQDYKAPAKVKGCYVLFPANKYLSAIDCPDDDILETYFEKNKDRFAEENNFSTSKDKVLQTWKEEQALHRATQKADEFISQLYRQRIEFNSPSFQKLLTQEAITLRTFPEFSQSNLPEIPEIRQKDFQTLFEIPEGQYFSEVFTHQKGAYILFLEALTPERLFSYNEIKSQIQKDWAAQKKEKAFQAYVEQLDKKVHKQIEQNYTLEKIASNLSLSLETKNEVSFAHLKKSWNTEEIEALIELSPKTLSHPIFRQEKVYWLYLSEKTVSDLEKLSEETEKIRQRLQKQSSEEMLQEHIFTQLNQFIPAQKDRADA